MVDTRFNKEVQEVLKSRLKIALDTDSREATNEQNQPVIQTVVKARLLWQISPNRVDILDETETVVLEVPEQPAAGPGLQ